MAFTIPPRNKDSSWCKPRCSAVQAAEDTSTARRTNHAKMHPHPQSPVSCERKNSQRLDTVLPPPLLCFLVALLTQYAPTLAVKISLPWGFISSLYCEGEKPDFGDWTPQKLCLLNSPAKRKALGVIWGCATASLLWAQKSTYAPPGISEPGTESLSLPPQAQGQL